MGLMDRARKDLEKITTDDSSCGFAVPATFTNPLGETATVNCLHTVHHSSIDSEGVDISSKIASVAVSEDVLNAAGYTTRNAKGVVTFEDHRVDVADHTGNVRNYICREKYPDSNLGLFVVYLTDYDPDGVVPKRCADATAVNSDGSFSVDILSGFTEELPDVPVNVNGTELFTSPSVKDINIEVVNQNDDPIGAPNGNKWEVNTGTGEATVENSDQSYTQTVLEGSTLVTPDINITANNNLLESIPSIKNYDVEILDGNDQQVGTVETFEGRQIVRVAGGAPVGIAYNYPTPPKTYAVYQTGDAHWRFLNGDFNYPDEEGKRARLIDFFTLAENNIHGNTNRFTDVNGGQDYVISDNNKNMIKDHYTRIMWCVPNLGWRFWASAITNANNATNGGFNDWKLPVFNELSTIVYRGDGTGLNIPPFNILAPWLNDSVEIRNNIWTCETPENNIGTYKSVFYCNGAVISPSGDFFFSRALETDTFRSIYVRRF